LRALADEYKRRVGRHVELLEREVKDDAALAKAIAPDVHWVALEVDGKALTSTEFSRSLLDWTESGGGKLMFVIGGADGIPSEVSRKAQHRLSLSRMTLPHRLARIILFEQLYRASAIWRGEPYARED
jgi:23S rRNA (pseudouridine1915-N3)-methyltransferase